MNPLIISSPSISENGQILDKHAGKKGISPELQIEHLSSNCQSLAIIMECTSSYGKPSPYWIMWNIPPVSHIPEGIPAGPLVEILHPAQQGVAVGINAYRGPKNDFLHFKKQTFTLTVYALDTVLDLIFSAEKQHLMKAMSQHILQQGELHFTYQK